MTKITLNLAANQSSIVSFLITCLAVSLFLFFSPASLFAISGDILSVEKDGAAIRSGPETKHSVITRLTNKAKVCEKLRRGKWIAVEVVSSGQVGWIHSSLLSSETSPSQKEVPAPVNDISDTPATPPGKVRQTPAKQTAKQTNILPQPRPVLPSVSKKEQMLNVSLPDNIELQEDNTFRGKFVINSPSNLVETSITREARHGDVSIENGEAFVYTPQRDYTGEDSFTLLFSGSRDEKVEKKIAVQVLPVDDPPHIDVIALNAIVSPGRSNVYSLTGHDIDSEKISFVFTNELGQEITPVVYGLSLVLDSNKLSINTPPDAVGDIPLKNIQIRTLADGAYSKNFIAFPETISIIPAPNIQSPRYEKRQQQDTSPGLNSGKHKATAFSSENTETLGGEHFSRAGKYLDEGKYELAVQEFRKEIQAGNNHPLLFFDLAGALFETGELDNAVSEMTTAVNLAPDVSFFHSNLGKLYFMKREFRKAKEHFYEAIDINLGQAETYSYLAKISFDKKDYRSAWLLVKMAEVLGFHEQELTRKLLEKSKAPDIIPWKVEEDKYYLREILVDSRRMAERFMDRIQKGQPFDLVATMQDKTASAFAGGYLGYFALDELNPVLAESVEKLAIMAPPVIIETDNGFHVIQRIAPFNDELLKK